MHADIHIFIHIKGLGRVLGSIVEKNKGGVKVIRSYVVDPMSN